MRIVKLVFLLCFCNLFTIAQIKFDKRYPLGLASVGRKVVEIPGGYVCAGFEITDTNTNNNNLIVKTDLYGDTIKTLYIPPPDSSCWFLFGHEPDDILTDIINTKDSNLITLGITQAYQITNYYDYDIVLIKLNYNLDTLWLKTYSHPSDSAFQPQSIIQTSDGGFLICGKQRGFYNTNWYGFLYKVDSAGNFQWYKSYNNPGPYQAIWDVIELPNHSFMCSGTQVISNINDDMDCMLFITDSIGNQLWDTAIVTSGLDFSGSLCYSKDSNILWQGALRLGSSTFDPLTNTVRKVNYSGGILWNKNYQEYNNGGAVTIIKGINGGSVYCGITDNTTNIARAFVHRLDENGDSLWYREFGSSNYSDFWDIKTTSDGGYIMCGQTGGCNNNGGTCFWLVKTDSLGLLVTGIEEETIFKTATLSVYPNPTTTYCTLTATVPQTNHTGAGKKGASIILFDMRGKQLLEQPLQIGSNTVQLNLTNYAAGTYLAVLVLDGYNVKQVKVVKQ